MPMKAINLGELGPLGQWGRIKRFQLVCCDLDKINAKQHRLLNTVNGT